MDQNSLAQALQDLPINDILYLPTVGSTNDEVTKQAQGGAQPFSLVVADEQTKGRGRSGRSWHTPPGAAIAMSLLLPTNRISATDIPKITGLGALAVCKALLGYQSAAQIKWPNDVLLAGKKACGVLAEAHWRGDELEHVLIGMGINVATQSVPPAESLNFPATSVEEILGHKVQRETLIREVLARLLDWWPKLKTSGFINAWENHLAYKGEDVEIRSTGESIKAISGQLIGLDEHGYLRLRLSTSEEKSFEASEIHLRPRVDSQAN
ncbi:MAG: biotin--[acetyl-CoA-carboxylase] ligase [Chloroflexi bacterium]|nr:MAG: biotin--[acetyl-CoA-carboxylase] ligase [Chloroflexota bacterium]MBL1196875.1 biotin--[acetyl-CoA-carboxylase] ligase [Chloroflexota bacterium]NOH14171.1 biotin--[acetyl-CoA-carboxylase] ligase [Chloroflexota bacterium]